MLCEINAWGNFFTTWVFLTVLAFVSLIFLSGVVFIKFYVRPTFEQWRYKSNPKYPSAGKIREEIIQMTKGLCSATLSPALALYLSNRGVTQAYCGVNHGDLGLGYLVLSFCVSWVAADFLEFYYHRLGHISQFFWSQHKYHHVFYNPSPFAVIADDYVDQFCRSLPLLVFPMVAPINMDMLFIQFAIFFYAYGVYLHWGYETEWPDAHHPWINTAFQHYLHHAVSTAYKPYHTGFFLKLWDQMFGSMYDKDCFCAKCCRAAGKRTREEFAKIEIPDYSVLLKPTFWINGEAGHKAGKLA